ncbi:MAG: DUF4422 domain-containing protein [Kiritimatiellae bacterium]|nr:DUF4422 domain-containing protein [Kiritimatiellia bacterium]
MNPGVENTTQVLRVVVAAHKPYRMPEDPVYLPLQVGAAGKAPIGFARDDDGENISGRNRNWCELTGLYWAWKNLRADAVGLVHYRRLFKGRRGAASGAEFLKLLENHDVILPVKRRYYIETIHSHYAHAHHAEDLDATRGILAERHPGFLGSFDAVMAARSVHLFNMAVMKRSFFNAYCEWLFDVLFELERRLDISAYSRYDARVFGFVAERLLDVWLGAAEGGGAARTAEMKVLHLESQRWPSKAVAFLRRKFRSSAGNANMI